MTLTPTSTDLNSAAGTHSSEPLTGRDEIAARHRELRDRLAGTATAAGSSATTLSVAGHPPPPPHTVMARDGFAISSAGFVFDLSDIDAVDLDARDDYAHCLDRMFAAAARTRRRRYTVTLLHPSGSTL